MPYKSHQQRKFMWAKHPNATWHEKPKLLGTLKKEELKKQALEISYQQKPEIYCKQRQPSAVIIKGNPIYTKHNKHAAEFYNGLATHLRDKGYTVHFDNGEPHTVPRPADIWVGHSRGAERLAFAPKGTQKIALGCRGGVNHPLDTSFNSGQIPNVFHFLITKQMLSAIDRAHETKVKNPKSA